MPRNQLISRWDSDPFVSEKLRELRGLVKGRIIDDVADFKGISIGQNNSHPSLGSFSFAKCDLARCDFERASIASHFDGSKVSQVSFTRAKLIDCQMKRAIFKNCQFESARLAISCNDAAFRSCNFRDASWLGSFSRSCGGRRVSFVECDFSGCSFKQIEFRATRFENCIFDGASFVWCELAHVKYQGNSPAQSQIKEVDQEHILNWIKGNE